MRALTTMQERHIRTAVTPEEKYQAYMQWRESLSPEETAKHEAEMRKQWDYLPKMTAEEAAEADRMALDTNRDGL